MILYFTHTIRTRAFAEILGRVLNRPVYPLRSTLNNNTGLLFLLRALCLTATRKPYPVEGMEGGRLSVDGFEACDELYVCSPVWGGQVAAPVRYFLTRGNLKGKKVHLLLTCASIPGSEKYRQNALALLGGLDCIPGDVHVFASTGDLPEEDVVAEQMREMLS